MPFVRQKGISGQVWVPEDTDAAAKKHNCPDCECCHHCADSRCRICRNPAPCKKKRK